jgi:hypothetical protein
LAGILFEGVRGDGQNFLLWITDEDDIAPNREKHAEATRLLAHYVSSYLYRVLRDLPIRYDRIRSG